MSELYVVQAFFQVYLDRLKQLRADERGMTTETVIITAVLAALALGATAIIVSKVTGKANSIDTGGG
jgi:hypothetical protein